MTGVEGLLGPAIFKAAGGGTARAATWGAKGILANRRRRKIRSLINKNGPLDPAKILDGMTEAEIAAVVAYCESPEMLHAATTLARVRLIEGQGRKAGNLAQTVKEEMLSSLNLYMGRSPDPGLVEVLFSALLEAVSTNVGKLVQSGIATSPILQAETVKTIGSLSAASVRNASVLNTFREIGEIEDFAREIRSQAAAVHGSMRLPHAGTTRQVPYEQLYVQPRLTVVATSSKKNREGATSQAVGADSNTVDPYELAQESAPTGILDVLENCLRAVVLGDPGGGKSTLSNNLAYLIATENGAVGRVPFFVELRDYAKQLRGAAKQTLVSYLEDICRSPYEVVPPENAVEYLLLNDRAVVIFDGLDELLDTSLRRDVVQIVQSFMHKFPTCPILVTSRRIGYEEAPMDPDLFWTVQLGEFDESDVELYVQKWFQLDESIKPSVKRRLASSFMHDSSFVRDLRVNPLMLSLMCGIYASENYIPRNRPDVYEKCSLLLFDRWDKQRGIKPHLSFDAHVQAAMRSLALHMFTRSADAVLSRNEILKYMTAYLFKKRFGNEEDAENAAVEFLNFCKGRAWVLTEVGSDKYGFTHRTFLEYFSASQLVRLNPNPGDLFKQLLPKLRAQEWDVVTQLALQVLGKQVEDGADDFLSLVLDECDDSSTEHQFGLLSYVIRALQFVVPRPEIIDRVCRSAVLSLLSPQNDGEPAVLQWFLSVSSENAPRVGSALRRIVTSSLENNSVPEELIALTAFCVLGRAHRGSSYWHTWTDENIDIFGEFASRCSSKFWWLAVIRCERGDISVEELIRLQGLSVLYRHVTPNHVAGGPPIAYKLLTRQRYVSMLGSASPSLNRRMRRQVRSALHIIVTSRMRYARQYDASASILDFYPLRISSSLDLVLTLPMVEVALRRMSKIVEDRADHIRQMFGHNEDLTLLALCRDGSDSDVRAIVDRFESATRGDLVTRNALEAWLTRRHSYLYG